MVSNVVRLSFSARPRKTKLKQQCLNARGIYEKQHFSIHDDLAASTPEAIIRVRGMDPERTILVPAWGYLGGLRSPDPPLNGFANAYLGGLRPHRRPLKWLRQSYAPAGRSAGRGMGGGLFFEIHVPGGVILD